MASFVTRHCVSGVPVQILRQGVSRGKLVKSSALASTCARDSTKPLLDITLSDCTNTLLEAGMCRSVDMSMSSCLFDNNYMKPLM